jgi:hypothetical protein
MGVQAMLARDAEIEKREEVKLHWIICSYWEPSCQQKGALKRVIYIMYISHS